MQDDQKSRLSISVCMATYNGAEFIVEQLKSILAQLPESSEVVIADDGSTDATLELVRSLGDARIRVIASEGMRLGPIYNLERALASAKGEVIFLSDQDDVWLPEKVDRCLAALQQKTLVLHDAYLLRWVNNGLDDGFVRRGKLGAVRPYAKGILRNWLCNGYTGCCMAFRRQLLDRALPFPKDLPMHDQWLGLMAEKFHSVTYLPEPLVEYRQHSSNATHIEKSPAGILQKIKWRLDLAKALLFVRNRGAV